MIASTKMPEPRASPANTRSPARPLLIARRGLRVRTATLASSMLVTPAPPSGFFAIGAEPSAAPPSVSTAGLWSFSLVRAVSRLGEGGHGGLDLGEQVRGERGVADLGQFGLAGGAGGVGQEALDELALVTIEALGASHFVGHQDDRVGTRRLGGVVDAERQVVARALDLGVGDGLAGRVGGDRDVLARTVEDL